MNLEEETNKIREKVGDDCGIGGKIKFDLGDVGVIFVDASIVPNIVNNDNDDADCTISLSSEDFTQIQSGELDPTTAFMMGKLKIDGNMGLAMKIQGMMG
ncbi:MAG: hypothetical protein CFH01_00823 [Alphaproteobacteria bacterium MarineAlpha2_Bin1]|nr:MAG: hypothetical protein CFH01_00823 [Alphaproteobacteria bacterium MarineAlpha2_Bin1]|tara:strand:- start:1378 stop:1677 length:300 start_codon:yes stop_codon:yes gene_type:complete